MTLVMTNFLNHMHWIGDDRGLRIGSSSCVQVQLEPMPKFSSCQGVSLAVARWLIFWVHCGTLGNLIGINKGISQDLMKI